MKVLKLKFLLGLFIIFILSSSCAFAKDFRFAQVSDLRYSPSNKTMLNNIICDINKQKKIEFVVFTGDNIDRANPEFLEELLLNLKKLKVPYYIVLGDKDVNKHRNLSKKEYCTYLKKQTRYHKKAQPNYVFEKKGIVFFVVDGTKDVIPGTNGFYKDTVVEWVDANLDLYSKNKVIILQHFPLIAPNDRENYQTVKPENYIEVLGKHKNVIAVISGHFNTNKEIDVDGIKHISTAAAPQYRVIDIIDYETQNPTIWGEVKHASK